MTDIFKKLLTGKKLPETKAPPKVSKDKLWVDKEYDELRDLIKRVIGEK
jgi:hypothetical protein